MLALVDLLEAEHEERGRIDSTAIFAAIETAAAAESWPQRLH